QGEPVFALHLNRAVRQIIARRFRGANAAVTDKLDPRGIVEEAQDERRVVERQFAQPEPFRFEHGHGLAAASGRTLKFARSNTSSSSSSRGARAWGDTLRLSMRLNARRSPAAVVI